MWDMFFLSKRMTWCCNSCGLLVVTLISLGMAGCGERVVEAPAPKVAFEGSLNRMLDVNIPPGTTLQRSYSNGAVMIVMSEGARMRMRPSGKNWGEEITSGIGSITIAEPGDHAVQNVGESPVQLLAIENLRPRSGSTSTPSVAKGMTLSGESAAFGVYDAQLTANNTQITHVQQNPAVTVLIQGKVLTQGPENKDKAVGDVASGLKQLDRPGQWVFVPAGGSHYVVRLGVDPARIVEVELR